MGHWIVAPVSPLVEPVPAPEIRVNGIEAAEFTDGWLCFYWYGEEMPVEDQSQPAQHTLRLKMLIPPCRLPQIMVIFARCLSFEPPEQPSPPTAPLNGRRFHVVR